MCPHDGYPLKKHYFSGDSGIGIDNCIKCDGFWIDGDEMKALFEYTKHNPSLDRAVTSLINEQQKSQKELEELKNLPHTLASMLTNPLYAAHATLQYIIQLIIEELDKKNKSL